LKLKFYKYQGAGNDFILLDDRLHKINLSRNQIAQLCNRNFGIGADGLIMLREKFGYDFEMVYYNSDGNKSSMCGNGGRCIVTFSNYLGHTKKSEVLFWAPDGPHQASIKKKLVRLKMNDVKEIEESKNNFFLNTGSPHYVKFVSKVDLLNVFEEGRKIRYNNRFKKEGTNVNFVEVTAKDKLKVRTYERGVENETLSCGTGVTASALAYAEHTKKEKGAINISTPGGKLKVVFQKRNGFYTSIFLEGPAEQTFVGEITI
jgi:diaminopimelate epimerase